jgi:hypothetical protein
MRFALRFIAFGFLAVFLNAPKLGADQVDMQNGDHYSGKVLSVSADTVVLDSDMLGKINVPRKKVASLAFGTNNVVASQTAKNAGPVPVPAKLPAALTNTNADLTAALHNEGANTNFIRQIREQMLAGSPEAAGKYDEMVDSLMNGTLNIGDLRRQAKSSADQLRALKLDLGPDAGDSLDGYLEVLDQFVRETANEPASPAPAPPPKSPAP